MRQKGETQPTDLWGNDVGIAKAKKKNDGKATASNNGENLPSKLGKAVRLPVPDFADPTRRPTCLEVDFPIAQINALSNLEGNAGKPIYQMSKWWARRRSSVFRAMLIAAATEAPKDASEAAKRVWDHYYCNHQKAGSFKHLRVLDPFMGGGTTLVEGARLGIQMTGVDLNPVAWFVVKNELACSDPEQVRALFDEIEREVKPQVQPFYVTSCPRGHQGRWVDAQSAETIDMDAIDLPPKERSRYRWEGPEVIYTFWAKHGRCQAKGCEHRTPIFRTPVIAEKSLSTSYAELTCPNCGLKYHAELGETRLAPGAERVLLEDEAPFREMSQGFAQLLKQYDKGTANDTWERVLALKARAADEGGLHCPRCGTFAGKRLVEVLSRHAEPRLGATQRKKKDFGLKTKAVHMFLLVHPEWLKGAAGDEDGEELGGWAGATATATAIWFQRRLGGLALVEVRGEVLPVRVTLSDGTRVETTGGTVPKQAQFTCGRCGKGQDRLEATKKVRHTAPVAAYALQCHCPQCETEGYGYGGRYFKVLDAEDARRLIFAEAEWAQRADTDLSDFWPKQALPYAHMTHERNPLPDHGYTHWWMLFNNRQLLVHASLLKSITEAGEDKWPFDVREQALGAFQQYLRNQNMSSFYHVKRDCLAPSLSNPNFNPKANPIEVSVYSDGYGPWKTTCLGVLEGLEWALKPWEPLIVENGGVRKSVRIDSDETVVPGSDLFSTSSTDLVVLGNHLFDLVITDPPFGDNLYYADCADFFHVWLRMPLLRWYAGLPEREYFEQERTPHSLEAVDNPAEHPDDREDYEKVPFVDAEHLGMIRELTADTMLEEKARNPLYRPLPSSDFYSQTLSACWAEAGRRLKNGGIMAFTFHHNEDQAWNDVLHALFEAGFVLVATYPIRSDESKGEHGEFGSKKIEYDIIHVCRKRLSVSEAVSWARMRRWVKDEALRLKELLEHTHGKELPESDTRVILRGKALEFYSRHFGQVFTGEGQPLDVREALLGINQILDDLLEETAQSGGPRPPDSAEPASRLYLRLFQNRDEMDRDELHKTLRGTGIAQGDLEARGWITVSGRTVGATPIKERLAYFTEPGRNRKTIKSDLDQAHFLIGAAMANSVLKIEAELNNPNFRIKRSVDDILNWYGEVATEGSTRTAAEVAARLVEHWRSRKGRAEVEQLTLFEMLEESE